MIKIGVLLCCLISFVGVSATEREISQLMKSDLDFLKNTFEVYYAPKEWKQQYFGWDLNHEIQKAKIKIDSIPFINPKQYRTIVKEFFQSMKDYHVTVTFYSTEQASLPFSVKGVNGKYFISYIDTENLPQNVPLKVGDELTHFDNIPVQSIVEELMQKETCHSNKEADHSFACYFLTRRTAEMGHEVLQGRVIITVKHKGSLHTKKYPLKWDYIPEKIGESPLAIQRGLIQPSQNNRTFKDRCSHFYSALKNLKLSETEDFLFGSRKSFLPPFGKILWSSTDDNPFYAYLYEASNGKKIGYIRIPDFNKDEEDIKEFARSIAYLEKNSSALIIDQLNNPGGNDSFLLDSLSVLTNKPLRLPLEKVMITQEEIETAIQRLEFFDLLLLLQEAGIDTSDIYSSERMANSRNYEEFLISEWNQGRNFTIPYYPQGIEVLNPSSKYSFYTKPILILVNELDLSCGDFFPAIMQDNHRATLFGTKTAGAGGYVLHTTFPNRFGIKAFSYTASIAERADKNPIENLGVIPDIEYEVTEDDLQNNYRGYVKAVNMAILNLIQ